MYELNFKKRAWLVKKRIAGISPKKFALAQIISESYIRRLMKIYKQYGWDGLKDHKTGRPETILNQSAVILILDCFLWVHTPQLAVIIEFRGNTKNPIACEDIITYPAACCDWVFDF